MKAIIQSDGKRPTGRDAVKLRARQSCVQCCWKCRAEVEYIRTGLLATIAPDCESSSADRWPRGFLDVPGMSQYIEALQGWRVRARHGAFHLRSSRCRTSLDTPGGSFGVLCSDSASLACFGYLSRRYYRPSLLYCRLIELVGYLFNSKHHDAGSCWGSIDVFAMDARCF